MLYMNEWVDGLINYDYELKSLFMKGNDNDGDDDDDGKKVL